MDSETINKKPAATLMIHWAAAIAGIGLSFFSATVYLIWLYKHDMPLAFAPALITAAALVWLLPLLLVSVGQRLGKIHRKRMAAWSFAALQLILLAILSVMTF